MGWVLGSRICPQPFPAVCYALHLPKAQLLSGFLQEGSVSLFCSVWFEVHGLSSVCRQDTQVRTQGDASSLCMLLCTCIERSRAFGELWHVCSVVGLLRAALVSWQHCSLLKWSSQKLLPVERTVALSMTKIPSSLELFCMQSYWCVLFCLLACKNGGGAGRQI